jgi:thioredoxin-related protein
MSTLRKLLLLSILFGCFAIQSQEKEILKVYSFDDVEKIHPQNPKPIVVFLYTDWCKICFGMKKNTFEDSKVINLLNDNFYFIKLNGEEKKDITFLGKKFVYKPSGNKTGTHELAKALGSINDRISYPTTVILNKKLEINIQLDSYVNVKKMLLILNESK